MPTPFKYNSLAKITLALELIVIALVPAQADTARVRFAAHKSGVLAQSQALGRMTSAQTVSVTFALPLRHADDLDGLLQDLYDPASPHYGQFLSPAQFTAQFAPTQADYNAVAAFARTQGLTVTCTHPNRLLLDVSGSATAVETALGVRMQQYRAPGGRVFHAPDADPSLPASLAGRVTAIAGLSDAVVPTPASLAQLVPAARNEYDLSALQTGSGVGGGLSPADIKAAYNLNNQPLNGAGQTLGLVEFDGYNGPDVAAYAHQYGLPAVPLQNVLINGYNGHAGASSGEVVLDIELQMALAPGARKILVYEGANILDVFNRVATDNQAKQISASWGVNEKDLGAAGGNALNAIFKQMAAQGQTMFVSSGDNGAYTDGKSLSVNGLASPPYACGVGGTTLATSGPGGGWRGETTWTGSMQGLQSNSGGSGGGVSAIWGKPDYQVGMGASGTSRNLPDVALDADPGTGYSIYWNGGWYYFGGTSAAAPLWAAFTALTNQQRAAYGLAPVGFLNPQLYKLASSDRYGRDFHDIADNSSNLYYHAGRGYDNATGLGTFNGVNLISDLAASAPAPPAAPGGLNASAGDKQAVLTWNRVAGASTYIVRRGEAGNGIYTVGYGGLTGTSFTSTGLANGKTYYYTVSATGPGGESSQSAPVSVTPKTGRR